MLLFGAPPPVSAAVAAARTTPSLTVTLLANGSHVGGMTTGGLSETDLRDPSILGGIALEFYNKAGRTLEPHNAEKILLEMLHNVSAQVTVVYRTLGVQSVGFERTISSNIITNITTNSGQVFSGKVFIDCSYEGDLLIHGPVPYTYGRESNTTFNETRAGIQAWPYPYSDGGQQYPTWHNYSINPYDSKGNLLPFINSDVDKKLIPGAGDKKVMSYNFRLCITTNATNKVAFYKPSSYNVSAFEVLTRFLAIEPHLHQLNAGLCPGHRRQPGCGMFIMSPLPNNKVDLNALGPFSTDVLGSQYEYPTGNVSVRNRIFDEHKIFTQKLLYYMTHETDLVPPQMWKPLSEFGLCADEFVDTEHWPPQLYVRESVRMIGSYILTEHDCTRGGNLKKSTSVLLSDWEIDVHQTQRVAIVNPDDPTQIRVTDEGEVEGSPVAHTYEVPFEALIPRREDATNLIVPVCISASHVAFATYRLEPQYFIAGQSAAVAAALFVTNSSLLTIQDLDINVLQHTLISQGQKLFLQPPSPAMYNISVQPCRAKDNSQKWSYAVDDHTLRSGEQNDSCVSIYGYSGADGARIVLAACHTQDKNPSHQNQEFSLPFNTWSPIKSTMTKKCLSVDKNFRLVQEPCTTSGMFKYFPHNGTVLHATGRCMDWGEGALGRV
eukprot:m.187838 g.187838  ORF g.187838 m.187838 type:complete len:664 (-) comp25627_c2_seq3:65-2056(-)